MDSEIEDLKRLVQKNIAIAEDTNRLVRKMRRGALWGRVFQIVWWLLFLAVSGAAYYYYLQPYVQKVENFYTQVQTSGKQAQGFEGQVQQFINSFRQ